VTPDKGLVKFDVGTGDVTQSGADLPGSSGDYFSTPDSAANTIRQTITFEADVALDDYTSGAVQTIIGKGLSATVARGYRFEVTATGELSITLSLVGNTPQVTSVSPVLGLGDGVRATLKAVWDSIEQTATYFLNGAQVGVAPHVIASIHDSTSEVEIGSVNGGVSNLSAGTIYSATVTKGPTPYPYVLLDGVSGTYVSTPDSAANSVTGSITFIACAAYDDWTPATDDRAFISKWVTAGSQRSFIFRINTTTGTLQIVTSSDGSNAGLTTSTVATGFVDGTAHWVRATLDSDADVVNFYTSDESELTPYDDLSWNLLGDPDQAHTTGVFDGTSDVEVGAIEAGTSDLVEGSIIRAVIIPSTDPTAAASVDFYPQPYLQGDSTFVAPETGETWTLQGNAIATSPIDDGVKVDFNPGAYQGGDGWFQGQLGPELIANNLFAEGTTGWTFDANGGGGSFEVTDGRVTLFQGGASKWIGIFNTTPIDASNMNTILVTVKMVQSTTTGSKRLGGHDVPGITSTPDQGYVSLTGSGVDVIMVTTIDVSADDDSYINVIDGQAANAQTTWEKVSARQVVSGYLWTINGNASVVASTKMRSLYIDPQAFPAFPIYASTGQALASQGAGGLTWDANGRLRITQTLPSALTRTNLLAVEDITDVSNWTVLSGADLYYRGDGIFEINNLSVPASGYVATINVDAGSSIDGKTYLAAMQVRATGDQIGKVASFTLNRQSGGSSVIQTGTQVLTAAWKELVVSEITGTTSNTGVSLICRNDSGNTADSYEFRFPTIEETTSYPAGVPPIVIPVDALGAEVITNGTFDTNTTGWTAVDAANISWSASGAEVDITGAGGGIGDDQTFLLNATKTYELSYQAKAGTYVGSLSTLINGGTVRTDTLTTSFQTFTVTFTGTVDPSIKLVRATAATGTIFVNNISVKQTGAIEVAAQYPLPGGMKSSGPTQELIVYGEQQVWHQGVGLTNQGYVADYLTNTLLAEALVWLDETTITGDGQVSAWTNQGIGGSDYDLDTVVGTAANLTVLPNDAARLPGASSDYLSTPDTTANSITGTFRIDWEGELDDWTPSAVVTLLSKWDVSIANRSYMLRIWAAGNVELFVSADGTATTNGVSTEITGLTNGTSAKISAVWDQALQQVTFYVDDVQLGDVVSLASSAVFDGTDNIEIGGRTSGTVDVATGYCESAQVYNGANTPATSYVTFDGASDYVSTPASSALTIDGDFDAVFSIQPDSYASGSRVAIASRYVSTSGQKGWEINIEAAGELRLLLTLDGINTDRAISTEALGATDGTLSHIRVVRESLTGDVTFYEGDTADGLTQLGDVVSTDAGAMFDASTVELRMGERSGGGSNYVGKIHYMEIRNGIDGDIAAKFDPADYLSGTTWQTPVTEYGPELVYNGDFDGDFSWDKGTGWSIGAGLGTKTSGTSGTKLNQDPDALTTGVLYQAQYALSDYSGTGDFRFRLGTAYAQAVSANGSYTDYLIAASITAGTEINIFAVNSGMGGSFDGVSVRACVVGGETWTLNGAAAVSQFEATGSTLVVDFDPSDYVSGSTFTDSLGATWTLNGDVFINKTGQSVVNSAGDVALGSAASQIVLNPFTVFLAGKFTLGTPIEDQFFFDSFTGEAADHRTMIYSDLSLGNVWATFQDGSNVSVVGYDTEPHVVTGEYKGGPGTKLTVSDVGDATGDAGTDNYKYMNMFAQTNNNALLQAPMWIGEFIIFPRALTATEITDMQNYLQDKWL
jgi:hypothetical protein